MLPGHTASGHLRSALRTAAAAAARRALTQKGRKDARTSARQLVRGVCVWRLAEQLRQRRRRAQQREQNEQRDGGGGARHGKRVAATQVRDSAHAQASAATSSMCASARARSPRQTRARDCDTPPPPSAVKRAAIEKAATTFIPRTAPSRGCSQLRARRRGAATTSKTPLALGARTRRARFVQCALLVEDARRDGGDERGALAAAVLREHQLKLQRAARHHACTAA